MLLAAVLAVAVALPAVAQETVSVGSFLERVGDAREVAVASAEDPSEAAMERVRAALRLPVVVDLPAGPLSLSRDAFLEQLDGDARQDFLRADAHLAEVERQVRAAAAVEAVDAARVADALRGAFRDVDRGLPLSAILLGYVQRFVVALFRAVSGGGLISIVLWLILGVVVFLLLRALFRWTGLVPERELATPMALAVSPDPLREADDALARGDLRTGIRALYRAIVAALASRGAVRDAPSVTAGECRAALRSSPGIYEDVARAVGVYERVVYARDDPRLDDVEAMRRGVRAARAR